MTMDVTPTEAELRLKESLPLGSTNHCLTPFLSGDDLKIKASWALNGSQFSQELSFGERYNFDDASSTFIDSFVFNKTNPNAIKLLFIGIDNWNRPTFKESSTGTHFCIVDKVLGIHEKPSHADLEKLLKSYSLYEKGNSFNGEPSHPVAKDFCLIANQSKRNTYNL